MALPFRPCARVSRDATTKRTLLALQTTTTTNSANCGDSLPLFLSIAECVVVVTTAATPNPSYSQDGGRSGARPTPRSALLVVHRRTDNTLFLCAYHALFLGQRDDDHNNDARHREPRTEERHQRSSSSPATTLPVLRPETRRRGSFGGNMGVVDLLLSS